MNKSAGLTPRFPLLLVDDDPNMQRMVALFLKKNNYDISVDKKKRSDPKLQWIQLRC